MNEAHTRAMDTAEQALLLRLRGSSEEAKMLYREAFALEQDAALSFKDSTAEPSRSVLFRSAASLAMSAGMSREAERMIAHGLSGDAPEDIAEELRDLLEQLYFERHLSTAGVTLDRSAIQLALAGPGVGYGFIRSDHFMRRASALEKLVYRTAERLAGKPFRAKGRTQKDIAEQFRPYMSAPRAASFSVTMRFGSHSGHPLLFPDKSPSVGVELVEDLIMVNDLREGELKERVVDNEYYRNLIGLARELSPDTEEVSLVGITAYDGEAERSVEFVRSKKEIPFPIEDAEDETDGEHVEVVGTIDWASAQAESVKLTDEQGTRHTIAIDRSLMADVVRPYWEQEVRVSGVRSGNTIRMSDINAVL